MIQPYVETVTLTENERRILRNVESLSGYTHAFAQVVKAVEEIVADHLGARTRSAALTEKERNTLGNLHALHTYPVAFAKLTAVVERILANRLSVPVPTPAKPAAKTATVKPKSDTLRRARRRGALAKTRIDMGPDPRTLTPTPFQKDPMAAPENAPATLCETPEVIDFAVHPSDLAPGETPDKHFYRSCKSHCCRSHGCKYAYEGCPVETGQVTQDHPCEQCTYTIDDAARYDGSGYSRPGEVGYQVTIGLKHASPTETMNMADLPTDAQVHAAISKALTDLNVNGWTLTRIIGGEDE